MKISSTHSILAFLFLSPVASAAITVSAPSTEWTPFAGNYDYLDDQQTGQADSDIVGGTLNDSGFFVAFNDDGSASATDGTIGYRIRLDEAGDKKNPPAFHGLLWVGIDADINGSVDMFIGLNFQGNMSEIGIYDSGSGANTSPNTTTIDSGAYKTFATTLDGNYSYRAVDYTIDGGTTNDATSSTTGDPDYYASFMLPFSDIVGFLATKSIGITDASPLRYVLATSTQTNSLNQDLGGVNGGINSSTTWEELGGFSAIVSASGAPVPEPTSFMFALLALGSVLTIRRRC